MPCRPVHNKVTSALDPSYRLSLSVVTCMFVSALVQRSHRVKYMSQIVVSLHVLPYSLLLVVLGYNPYLAYIKWFTIQLVRTALPVHSNTLNTVKIIIPFTVAVVVSFLLTFIVRTLAIHVRVALKASMSRNLSIRGFFLIHIMIHEKEISTASSAYNQRLRGRMQRNKFTFWRGDSGGSRASGRGAPLPSHLHYYYIQAKIL